MSEKRKLGDLINQRNFLALGMVLLLVGIGYGVGQLLPAQSIASPNPGTCLPIEKGGTGCDATETAKFLTDAIYPVGSILTTTTNNNPGAYLGGTWQAFGDGRTLVGMGSNGTNNYATVESTGGSDSVTLTTAQMPSHTHVQNPHTHTILNGYNTGSTQLLYFINGSVSFWSTTFSGAATATNQNTGGSESHENRQSYITVYFWKRTN